MGDFHAGRFRITVIAGQGMALMPDHVIASALRSGQLVRVLPDRHGEIRIAHLIFTTRTGLPPQVQAWIDHLAERFGDKTLFAPVLA